MTLFPPDLTEGELLCRAERFGLRYGHTAPVSVWVRLWDWLRRMIG